MVYLPTCSGFFHGFHAGIGQQYISPRIRSDSLTDSSRLQSGRGVARPLGKDSPPETPECSLTGPAKSTGIFSVGRFAGRSRQDLCGDRAEGDLVEVESCICYHAISCKMHRYVYIYIIYVDIYIFIMYHVLLDV